MSEREEMSTQPTNTIQQAGGAGGVEPKKRAGRPRRNQESSGGTVGSGSSVGTSPESRRNRSSNQAKARTHAAARDTIGGDVDVNVDVDVDTDAGAEATITYDPEIGPGYFVQTRSDFLRFPYFSPTVKVLYQVLCSYAGAGAKAFPGQDRLAKECAVTKPTLRKALRTLIDVELVTSYRRGLNLTNNYHVHKLPTLKALSRKVSERRESPAPGTGKTASTAEPSEPLQASALAPVSSNEPHEPQQPRRRGRPPRSATAAQPQGSPQLDSVDLRHPGHTAPSEATLLPSGGSGEADTDSEKGTRKSSLREITRGVAASGNSGDTPPQPTAVGVEQVHKPLHEAVHEGEDEYRRKRLPGDGLPQDSGEIHLLIEELGFSEQSASELVSLAAQNGRNEGYITDLVEYATTARGINNPAGLVVALIQRNETRSPGDHHSEAQVRLDAVTIDPRNYTGDGKYAFLFVGDRRPRRQADPYHSARPPDAQLPNSGPPEAASA